MSGLLNQISRLGSAAIAMIAAVGRSILLLGRMLSYTGEVVRKPELLIQQLYHIGVLSILIIAISAMFVGMVLALQGHNILSRFSADSSLGVLVATSLIRELAPVISALLFAGRAGSAITAEVGLMKTSQQLAALEMMAVDPIKRILLPRFLAVCIALPLLNAIFIVIGIASAYVFSTSIIAVDGGIYWAQMTAVISGGDISNSMLKSAVFALLCGLIAVYQGYESQPAPQQVALATTTTVVLSALLVLSFDFILTAMMFGTE